MNKARASIDAAVDSSLPSLNQDCLDRAVKWERDGWTLSQQYTILPGGGFEVRPRIYSTAPEKDGGNDADGGDVGNRGTQVLGEPSCVSALPPCGTSKLCLTDICNALSHPDVQEAASNSPVEFDTYFRGLDGYVFRIRVGDAEILFGETGTSGTVPPGINQLKHVLMSVVVQQVSACTGELSCDGANMALAYSPPEASKDCAAYLRLGDSYACFDDCAQANDCSCPLSELYLGKPVDRCGMATCW